MNEWKQPGDIDATEYPAHYFNLKARARQAHEIIKNGLDIFDDTDWEYTLMLLGEMQPYDMSIEDFEIC